jgi:hypothetical protein
VHPSLRLGGRSVGSSILASLSEAGGTMNPAESVSPFPLTEAAEYIVYGCTPAAHPSKWGSTKDWGAEWAK